MSAHDGSSERLDEFIGVGGIGRGTKKRGEMTKWRAEIIMLIAAASLSNYFYAQKREKKYHKMSKSQFLITESTLNYRHRLKGKEKWLIWHRTSPKKKGIFLFSSRENDARNVMPECNLGKKQNHKINIHFNYV